MKNGGNTLLADRGGFWIDDWHMVPLRPELRKLLGVEMVEVPLSWVCTGREVGQLFSHSPRVAAHSSHTVSLTKQQHSNFLPFLLSRVWESLPSASWTVSSLMFRITCPPGSVSSSSVAVSKKNNLVTVTTLSLKENVRLSVVFRAMTHPFQFLLLLFSVVLIPLFLDVFKKFLSIHKELFVVLLLPSINLGLQTLFKLGGGQITHSAMLTEGSNPNQMLTTTNQVNLHLNIPIYWSQLVMHPASQLLPLLMCAEHMTSFPFDNINNSNSVSVFTDTLHS